MVIACVGVILAAAFLGGLYYAYRLAFYYRDPQKAVLDYQKNEQTAGVEERLDRAIAGFLAAPCEEVSIRSQDGLLLAGRYYHLADGAPLQIWCHGYKGNGIWDFCGVWPLAQELGHNVLLIDQRCHRHSQGHTITFGIREHQDCMDWIDYAASRFGPVPMMLMGVSMGAATVLMAAGRELPPQVRCIAADCPYDSPANIMKKVLAVEMNLPAKLVYPFIRLGAIVYGGFDPERWSPLEAVKRTDTPILLTHGSEDRFVPHAMSCRLSEAAPDQIEFHTISGAGHALDAVTAPEEFRELFLAFAEKHLQPERG